MKRRNKDDPAPESSKLDDAGRRLNRKSNNGAANVYNSQPDSSSVIGGHRGEQEYGVEGSVVEDAEHEIVANPGAEDGEQELDFKREPLPYGEMDRGFPGISEWSAERGLTPEDEIIDEEEHARRHLKRGDDEIRLQLMERLAERKEIFDLRRLAVRVDHADVRIDGEVPSHHAAVDVREVAEAIPGVGRVETHLRVIDASVKQV